MVISIVLLTRPNLTPTTGSLSGDSCRACLLIEPDAFFTSDSLICPRLPTISTTVAVLPDSISSTFKPMSSDSSSLRNRCVSQKSASVPRNVILLPTDIESAASITSSFPSELFVSDGHSISSAPKSALRLTSKLFSCLTSIDENGFQTRRTCSAR